MDLRKIFPHAMGARDLKGLIIAIVIYAVVSFVGGIPLVGMVIGVIGWLLGIYCTVGIIISILVFLKVVK